jgi:antitoxin HicB
MYPAKFEPGENPETLVVTFRDIPEAITQGEGLKVAIWHATDCLEEAIAGRVADGREIPTLSKAARRERLIPVPAPTAAKAALYLDKPQPRVAAAKDAQICTTRTTGIRTSPSPCGNPVR